MLVTVAAPAWAEHPASQTQDAVLDGTPVGGAVAVVREEWHAARVDPVAYAAAWSEPGAVERNASVGVRLACWSADYYTAGAAEDVSSEAGCRDSGAPTVEAGKQAWYQTVAEAALADVAALPAYVVGLVEPAVEAVQDAVRFVRDLLGL